jgi:hypothetical protein
VEWYENTVLGLEQGFTLHERPSGAGPLVLEMALEGGLLALAEEGGREVSLIPPGGTLAVLRYSGLRVEDAAGRELGARLEVRADEGGGGSHLRIVVDDGGAVYPVTIDPLITGAAWSSAESDQTGAVAWGDWDGDDDLDLAAGNHSQPNRVYENAGNVLASTWSFIPAAAVAGGAQGAFFQTDVEINNRSASDDATVTFGWLPRGADNSEFATSGPITLGPGRSLQFENALIELFGLGPDSLGALVIISDIPSVVGMSRTYNLPGGQAAGTFGQGLPAIPTTEMISGTKPQRIIFVSEDTDSRANVGCVNGSERATRVFIELFNSEGVSLETKTMYLPPYSNNQINRVFHDYAPVNGYVDIWANRDDALYTCYGSMLDNLTSDPTTVLPQ